MTTVNIPGLVLTDHEFLIPLDHSRLEGEKITVFAREVVAPGKEHEHMPWLLFLQGGPGFPSPRPEFNKGWLQRALKDYRVLLLDQRGTGRSSPVLAQTLARMPDPQTQAEFLLNFRADAIVQDAEWIRRKLLGKNSQWSVLGQSYGGFCAVHYLSKHPESLSEILITGGIPPLDKTPDEIYRATYSRVLEKNEFFYERYPGDIEKAAEIVEFLRGNEVKLPGGGSLTARRFQQLGILFGAENGFEKLHYLLEGAFVEGKNGKELSYSFLRGVENLQHFETNPIYAVLHEAIYCQETALNWSAERVRVEFKQFDLSQNQTVYFTGEMIYPWMFEDYLNLHPMAAAAHIIATYDEWPQLYDVQVLRKNAVPCAAAVYYNDMYVERSFSEGTASDIKGLKMWVTNEYEHSALRYHGDIILDTLLEMLHGKR